MDFESSGNNAKLEKKYHSFVSKIAHVDNVEYAY